MAHIVYVIGSMQVGGAERHLSLIAPRMCEQGHQVTVFCIFGGGPLEEVFEGTGVNLVTIDHTFPSGVRRFRILRMLWIVSKLGVLLRYLLQTKPEIVHTFLPAAYLIGGTFAVLARVPIRLMSRRGRAFYFLKRPWARRYELFLHKYTSGFLGNSKRVVQDLREEGIPEDQLHLIYNGVEVERFTEAVGASHMRDSSRKSFTIVCLANLIAYKGHADLLRAMAHVENRMPENWRLQLIGRDDGHASALKQLADELNISDRVVFLGSRSDIPELLANADLGVLASHEEGFSNAVIECMSASLPMVVTDVGGNAEAVSSDVGRVVPPKEPKVLGTAILEMTLSNGLDQMGLAAAKRAQSLYSIKGCVTEYTELYNFYLSKTAVSRG